ncbi:MAG: hypothetical protein QJR10_10430 [Bacillota bacterium]|nr:hypothetical protein [Bacillota bacterium]
MEMPTGTEKTMTAIRAKNRCMKPPRLYMDLPARRLSLPEADASGSPLMKDKILKFECKSWQEDEQAAES